MHNIIRNFEDGSKQTLRTGLSYDEAKTHIMDRENHSNTCTLKRNKDRTERLGVWFDTMIAVNDNKVCEPEVSYKIVRIFENGTKRTIKKGLPLSEAQAHCADPETSSATCQKRINVDRAKRCGRWFDAYDTDGGIIQSEDAGSYNVDKSENTDEDEIVKQALDILTKRLKNENGFVTNPQAAADLLRLSIAAREYESFGVLFLNTRHQMIKFSELFRGTIDGASVYPREVVREAISCNAAAVIFAHNHPSGVVTPSKADIKITAKLKDALELVDVRVLDHMVVGAEDTASLAELGYI